jgi:hypothetical protein
MSLFDTLSLQLVDSSEPVRWIHHPLSTAEDRLTVARTGARLARDWRALVRFPT